MIPAEEEARTRASVSNSSGIHAEQESNADRPAILIYNVGGKLFGID